MSIAGRSSLRRLKDVAVESGPARGRPSRSVGLERVRAAAARAVRPDVQGSSGSAPALVSRDQPDVAAARQTLEWKLLAHPGHEFGPRNPRGIVRVGLLIRCAAAPGAVTAVPMPAGPSVVRLPPLPFRECCEGFSQPVVRREYSVIPMPMLPRRRHEIGQLREGVRHYFLIENELDPDRGQVSLGDWSRRHERRRCVTACLVCRRYEDTVGDSSRGGVDD